MKNESATLSRRMAFNAGLASGAGMLLPGCAMSPPSADPVQTRTGAFTRTDEGALSADDPSLSQRARELIRIGESGITRDNRPALEAFFDPGFRFHGPGGAKLDREQLWSYFAACRAAFDNFTVTRQTIMSDGADHLAARTRFAGTFTRPFSGFPGGVIQPNGKPFEYRLINIFRYSKQGRLVEEWVQYDVHSFTAQLRA